jgi:hypothetical protein
MFLWPIGYISIWLYSQTRMDCQGNCFGNCFYGMKAAENKKRMRIGIMPHAAEGAGRVTLVTTTRLHLLLQSSFKFSAEYLGRFA